GADYVCGVVPTVGRLWPDPDALYSHQPAIHWASKPLVWRRHILFVKPDYFVLLDELDSYVPCDWWLHVGGARAKSQQPQAPSLLVAQNTVTFERPDNVALDAFFLEPRQAQPKTGQVITTNGTTRHVAVADNGTTCFRAVLYPRYRTESRPTAELIAPGIIEVDRPGGWDLVVLDQAQRRYENRLRGVSIEGSVAVVRRNGSQWSAVLIAGRTIRLPGLRISAQAQISVARDRWGAMAFEVVEHSAPVIVLLEGQWLRRKRLRVEGQTPRPVVGSSAEVNLPAGLNRFAIE
ncbi:hypothetical protein FJY63_11400, partial [Candidatus Sumerlaeota bacterium]|nr:hypothetical protein [Candidatus Sumerlaeota bacterium]